MTPVNQTTKTPSLTACVASVLDVDASMVPRLDLDADWFERLAAFCEESGFGLMYWREQPQPVIAVGVNLILLISLEGHEGLHAIIGRTSVTDVAHDVGGISEFNLKITLVHDPNEDGLSGRFSVAGYVFIGKQ